MTRPPAVPRSPLAGRDLGQDLGQDLAQESGAAPAKSGRGKPGKGERQPADAPVPPSARPGAVIPPPAAPVPQAAPLPQAAPVLEPMPAPMPAVAAEEHHAHWASTVAVHVGAGRPSSTALDAAVGLARALEADVVAQYVEDQGLLSLAQLSCAREVTFGGRPGAALSFARLEADMQEAFVALRRDLMRRAANAGVPFDCRTVRNDPDEALAGLCAPRTVVALTEPFDAAQSRLLPRLFAECRVSGVLLCGLHAYTTTGPVAVLVSATTGLNTLLDAAASLLEADGRDLVLLTLGRDTAETAAFTSAARIATGYDTSVRMLAVEARRGPGMIAETTRRLGAGIVMATWDDSIAEFVPALVPALDCPLLLLAGTPR